MKEINLISDTVTIPCRKMMEFMFQAKVGDDVFGTDPTVNELEHKTAEMFGKEAALFCPSGTMTNQIALKINTQALDEIICNSLSHVVKYESAGYALLSGLSTQLIYQKDGKITVEQIKECIKPVHDWLSKSKLVVLENTCNAGGGTIYTLSEVEKISTFCKENNLRLHLDGARLFNALVETGEKTEDWGPLFDTVSICLSKGLGAPVGSLLIGSEEDIKLARRFRKVMGGGMRQVGYLAAAGLFALENNIARLKDDHTNAKLLAKSLENAPSIDFVTPPQTNILLFDIKKDIDMVEYLANLKANGIIGTAFGPKTVRLVTHKDVSGDQIAVACKILERI